MPEAPKQHRLKTATPYRAKAKRARPREHRQSSSARGYGRKWEAFRAAFLMSNPLCDFCKGKGIITPAQVVDHDIPHKGCPDLFWNNTFTALCKPCHDQTKQRMERSHTGQDLLDAIQRAKAGGMPKN